MRILITGGKGQLGTEVEKQLSEKHPSDQIFITDSSDLDITNMDKVMKVFREIHPDVAINCASFTNVEACEENEELAFRVNSAGARNLAVAAREVDGRIVHISTDYVFNGRGSQPLREYDAVDPLSVYGKSKAYSEELVASANHRHYIVRTAWLFGEGHNFVRSILKSGMEKGQLRVVDDQVGTPTSTVDLSRCLLELIETEAYGTYHGSGEGQCSWYEFAKAIIQYSGVNSEVFPIATSELNLKATRPGYSVLENFMLKINGMNHFRTWEDMLEEYIQKEMRR